MGSCLISPRPLVAMLGSARDMGVEQAFPLDHGLPLPYNGGEASIERSRGGGLKHGAGTKSEMPCGHGHGCSMDGWC
jgi:hypothetical protein